MTSADYLHTAFLLAKRANSKDIRPNPFVGAIIVDHHGIIIGEGYHQKAGEAHAEVIAIHDALQKNSDLSKSTLYVTLEPCSHTGKTPPCTNLILEKRIPKVVIGSMDPNTLVAGAQLLVAAGVEVEICILPEIVELNSTFNINQINRRPKFILKAATTSNGKIADRFGNSKWISNSKSRAYVHQVLRNNADAILTTAKTVIQDNATMNIRIDQAEAKELNVIIIDKQLDILNEKNKGLNIFYKRKETKIYLVTDKIVENHLPENVEIINVSMQDGACALNILGTILLQKNLCEILVEAGGKLNTSFIKEKLVDELNLFICPSLLIDNSGINIFNSNEPEEIDNKIQLSLVETQNFENDIFLKYKVLY
jgi:diaminohydroxyphosphoribosylaminopyrimidine deaminase/5-amino-6-(5-phosphoribosylamino)uracil reductase